MEKIITGDDSVTYYNEDVGEHYHTTSGAEEEARLKFVAPVKDKLVPRAVVFDICFGLGYNTAAALDVEKDLVVHAFENDRAILDQIPTLTTSFRSYPLLQEAVEHGAPFFRLHLGDVREELKKVEKADIIFFDPFSPKKQPELWTEALFALLATKVKPGAILTTYSCASHVRQHLHAAGFRVFDGPSVGRRAPSTVAIFDRH